MNFVLALCLILALAIQTNAFVFNGKVINMRAPLKMAAPAAPEWGLKTVTREKLMEVVTEAITKQLEEVEAGAVKLDAKLSDDFEADSVDVVAMLISLEANFKTELTETNTKVPMEKLSKLVTVKDLYDLMYDVLAEVESKKK